LEATYEGFENAGLSLRRFQAHRHPATLAPSQQTFPTCKHAITKVLPYTTQLACQHHWLPTGYRGSTIFEALPSRSTRLAHLV
jgi:hypothetical protein